MGVQLLARVAPFGAADFTMGTGGGPAVRDFADHWGPRYAAMGVREGGGTPHGSGGGE